MRTADGTMASEEAVAAVRLLLSQMRISPADLVTGSTAPTFAEVVPNPYHRRRP
ncbi:hypothetical protein [Nocardia tengchongensis]|uniref:hypothetical protein n=1 Tax=Nocardia tengchongensis TaxID=2055889 RepID=UPI003618D0B6